MSILGGAEVFGFLKKYTTQGLRDSIKNVMLEAKFCRLHLNGVRNARRYQGQKQLKLHLGAGPNIKQGFVNIDLSPRADLTLNLYEPLPFESGSCAMVYSEHFLEHVEYPDMAGSFLGECYRVLGSGGVFSVGVPDSEWPVRAYAGDAEYVEWFQKVKEYGYPAWCKTRMECVNYSFRQGREHRFAYDFETLKNALESVGFVDVKRREFDPGLDSKLREYSTLYVEAVKP